MKFWLGFGAALIAGCAFNAGILIQKQAVGKYQKKTGLMKYLVRDRIWIGGFALQFFIGSPLYALATGLIGPSLVPGLMSLGLIFLVWGAVRFYKEKITFRDILGIILLCLGLAGIGLSRLVIDVHRQNHFEAAFLIRYSIYLTGSIAAFYLFKNLFKNATAKGAKKNSGWNWAVASAIALNAGNLTLGAITYSLNRFAQSDFSWKNILLMTGNLVLIVTTNIAGISAMQYALSRGRLIYVVPLQEILGKILPVSVFFLIYFPYKPSWQAAMSLAAGLLCLAGSCFFFSAKLNSLKLAQE